MSIRLEGFHHVFGEPELSPVSADEVRRLHPEGLGRGGVCVEIAPCGVIEVDMVRRGGQNASQHSGLGGQLIDHALGRGGFHPHLLCYWVPPVATRTVNGPFGMKRASTATCP